MLKELLEKKADIEQRMELLQEEMSGVMRDINDGLSGKLVELRGLQGKEFGTVNLLFEGFKIVETIPKKVEWDQEKLAELFDLITAAGDNPRAYMKMKLEVGERQYDSFAVEVKQIFTEARTVKPGKPTLKFEEVPNA